ncbi:hypothetical protein SAMN05216570_4175 [Dyella sp. OK004]|nr:hypothetical protein SAMN05216570_4175 [Dyella sp. OK004]
MRTGAITRRMTHRMIPMMIYAMHASVTIHRHHSRAASRLITATTLRPRHPHQHQPRTQRQHQRQATATQMREETAGHKVSIASLRQPEQLWRWLHANAAACVSLETASRAPTTPPQPSPASRGGSTAALGDAKLVGNGTYVPAKALKKTIPTSDTGRCVATKHTACSQAISLWLLSLWASKEKVTRTAAAVRKPAAGEPGHTGATTERTTTGSLPTQG